MVAAFSTQQIFFEGIPVLNIQRKTSIFICFVVKKTAIDLSLAVFSCD
jgi:hypothetical protein